METLLVEIITHIMRFMSLDDRKQCSLVCKKWYSAFQDPSLMSGVFFCLSPYEDIQKCMDAREFIRQRNIKNLYFQSPKLTDGFWAHNLPRYWIYISKRCPTITNIHFETCTHKELPAAILKNIAKLFTSLKTVKINSTTLMSVLKSSNPRQATGGVINIPQVLLILETLNYVTLRQLLNWKLDITLVLIEFATSIYKIGETLMIANGAAHRMPLDDLRSFCLELGCAIHFAHVDVTLGELKLSEFMEEFLSIHKLKINTLVVTDNSSPSNTNKTTVLHELLKFDNITELTLPLAFSMNQLSKECLSATFLMFNSLKTLSYSGTLDSGTLNHVLYCFPIVESMHVSDSTNQWFCLTECFYAVVLLRTALNGKLKTLELSNYSASPYSSNSHQMPFGRSEFFSAVHSHLRELSLECNTFEFRDPNLLYKLTDCCPNLQKVRLALKDRVNVNDFEKNNNMYSICIDVFSRLQKLEVLELRNCNPVTDFALENFSFPSLKSLRLSFCTFVSDCDFIAITSAFQRVKCLNLSGCKGITNFSLKLALSRLHYLEELNLKDCKNVNVITLKIVSGSAPSLRILILSSGDEKFMHCIREMEKRHPFLQFRLF